MTSVKPAERQALIERHQLHDGDRGSAPVQIALLTQRINHLRDHFASAITTAGAASSRWSDGAAGSSSTSRRQIWRDTARSSRTSASGNRERGEASAGPDVSGRGASPMWAGGAPCTRMPAARRIPRHGGRDETDARISPPPARAGIHPGPGYTPAAIGT